MMDDPSDDLLGGFWPFIKRALMLLVPLWVFMLLWAAEVPTLAASILAGSSIALVIVYEKYKLRQMMIEDRHHNNDNK
jgi:hypothetical protein